MHCITIHRLLGTFSVVSGSPIKPLRERERCCSFISGFYTQTAASLDVSSITTSDKLKARCLSKRPGGIHYQEVSKAFFVLNNIVLKGPFDLTTFSSM